MTRNEVVSESMQPRTYSHHAEQRMRQRGRRPQDIDVLVRCGTQIGPNELLLTTHDAQAEISRLKREIQLLERLSGWMAVVQGDTLVTVYRPNDRRRKALFRNCDREGW
jgi:hypothetical protein